MEVVLWIIVIALFITSFVALVFPVLPSVVAVWGGFLVYHFFINSNELTTFFWVSMGIVTVVLLLADVFAGSLAVNRFGGSKWGERVAAITVIIGSFIYPPFGIIVLPFVAVLVVEWLQKRDLSASLRAAIGSLVGFLGGQVAEAIIQLMMIAWFFLAVWF